MKKIMALFLALGLTISMVTVGSIAVSANGSIGSITRNRFPNGASDLNASGFSFADKTDVSKTVSTIARGDDNGNAIQFAVTADAKKISLDDAPAYRNMVYCTGNAARKSLTISYDVNFVDYEDTYLNYNCTEDSQKLIGISAKGAAHEWYLGKDSATTFKSDGTINGASFEKNKWYNIQIIMDYCTKEVSAYLTDTATGTKQKIVDGEKLGNEVTELFYYYLEFYRPCTVGIDNLVVYESPAFGIYSPASGTTISTDSLSATVGVADNATSAGVYVNNSLIDEIVPGTTVANAKGQYEVNVPIPSSGDNVITLKQTTVNGEYSDEIIVNKAAYAEKSLQSYDFDTGNRYAVENTYLNGGIAPADSIFKLTMVPKTQEPASEDYGLLEVVTATSSTCFVNSNPFDSMFDIYREPGVYEFGYRFKVMQNCNIYAKTSIYKSNTADGNTGEITQTLMTSDGKIASGDSYQTDTWYTARTVTDSVNGTLSFYIDNHLCATQNIDKSYTIPRKNQLVFGSNAVGSKYALDSMYRKKIIPVTAGNLKGVKDGTETTAIYADSDSLNVTFGQSMDAATLTKENITVTSNDVSVPISGVTYDEVTKTANISLAGELTMCSDVVVTLSTNVSSGNATFEKPYQVIGNTDVKSYTTYGTFDITSDDDTYTATIPVYYTPDTEKDVMIIIAGYRDNVITGIKLDKVTLTHGKNILSVSKTGLDGNVKAFLWDYVTLTPLV